MPDTPSPAGESTHAPLLVASSRGLCPRCGAKTLFATVTRFADRCGSCGLDFARFNVGDGPAAFLILIVGGLIVTLAVILEVKVHPPFWLHLLLWVPLTIGIVIGSLRVSKAALLTLEYRNQAREGVLTKPPEG